MKIIGGNSEAVTGSCTEISYNGRMSLFECGMIQDGKTIFDNYKLNQCLLSKIKSKRIEYIFAGHCHCDHIGLIPALYAKGCAAKIIVPSGSTAILKEMWMDSAYINQRDVEYLSMKYDTKQDPLFIDADVETALGYVEEFPSNQIIQLNNELSFKFVPSGHILCANQMELFISLNSHTKKITFTSDLGNVKTEKERFFVEPFQPIAKSNIVIGECTYSARQRSMSKKDLRMDIEKIRTVITQFCIDNNGRVLIPSFSLDRVPFMIWILYSLFGNDPDFNIPVLVDSPLSIRLLKAYSDILEDDRKNMFMEMLSWNNLKFIESPEDSKSEVANKSSKIILSSSGMLTAGRSVYWTQSILPRSCDCILFVGYANHNTLAYRIKTGKSKKTININGKPCKNECQIVDLHSFSSHMQRDDLINYYKSFNAEKIYLVHSDKSTRLEFKEDLQEAIADCLKTTKVIAVNKSTVISV